MNDMEALTPEEKKAKEKKEKRLKRKQARAEFRKGILAKVNRREAGKYCWKKITAECCRLII